MALVEAIQRRAHVIIYRGRRNIVKADDTKCRAGGPTPRTQENQRESV